MTDFNREIKMSNLINRVLTLIILVLLGSIIALALLTIL